MMAVLLSACAVPVEQLPATPTQVPTRLANTSTPSTVLSPSSTPNPSLTPAFALRGLIAFTNVSRIFPGIALLNLKNGLIQNLSGNGSGTLAWSPDGQRLAFDGGILPAEQLDIFIIKPDGNYLAFIGRNKVTGTAMNLGEQIYVIDSGGRNFIAITDEKEWSLRDLDWTSGTVIK